MPRSNRYSPEVRERAVRMVAEHREEYPSEWAAFTSISAKLEMTPETLRVWVRRAPTDDGLRPGLTTDERQKLKDLEKEVKELRRVITLNPQSQSVVTGGSLTFSASAEGIPSPTAQWQASIWRQIVLSVWPQTVPLSDHSLLS
jgi:transposase